MPRVVNLPRQCIGASAGEDTARGVTRGVLLRGILLRGGVVAAAGVLLPAGAARAALPAPQPQGDDAGFLQFAALAELVSATYYAQAGDQRMATRKQGYFAKLTAALGADAPTADDFDVALPAKPKVTLGVKIETLLVRTYVGALASTVDGSTRLLLARLLAADSQHLMALRAAAKLPPVSGLPVPLDLDTAGAELDALLKAPNYPTT